MKQKEMNDLIDDYRRRFKYLKEPEVQKEIAIRLHAIFLQLKELTNSVDSISIPEDTP